MVRKSVAVWVYPELSVPVTVNVYEPAGVPSAPAVVATVRDGVAPGAADDGLARHDGATPVVTAGDTVQLNATGPEVPVPTLRSSVAVAVLPGMMEVG